MKTITFFQPWDFHFHARRDKMMRDVLPFTTKIFGGGVPMPNPVPEILSGPNWEIYLLELMEAGENSDFQFIGSIKLNDQETPQTPKTTLKTIDEAVACGVEVFKSYPIGVTTGSHASGVSDFYKMMPIFGHIRRHNKIASFHCELPGSDRRRAEIDFIPILQDIIEAFPDLRIIVEHASTRDMIELVKRSSQNVAATITPHHMRLTHEDVIADDDITMIDAHNYCKPVCNSHTDQLAIIQAAISGDSRFFFGSDSAPHPLEKKQGIEVSQVAAGVFNAPVALPVVVEIFEQYHALDQLNKFLSINGLNFYQMKPRLSTLTMIKKPWVVPYEYEGIGLWLGGKTLNWRVGPISIFQEHSVAA